MKNEYKYLVSVFNDDDEKGVYELFYTEEEARDYIAELKAGNFVSIEEINISKCIYRPVANTIEEIVK